MVLLLLWDSLMSSFSADGVKRLVVLATSARICRSDNGATIDVEADCFCLVGVVNGNDEADAVVSATAVGNAAVVTGEKRLRGESS